ncbi:MAG: HAD family hydrolase [Chloroflexota bacterium]
MPVLSPEVNTILFDLDGTLRISRPSGEDIFLDFVAGLGAPDDEGTRRAARQWAHRYWASSGEMKEDVKNFSGDEEAFWLNYALRKIEAMGVADGSAVAWAEQASQHMLESYEPEDVIPADVVPTLNALKAAGFKVGLLTNRSRPVGAYLEESGLDQHLDFWVYSGMLNVWKPDPEIFFYTLGMAGSVPEKSVYIGDNYFADVVGARRAKIQPVLIDPERIFPEADCPVINSIGELSELLGI